jgi:hypothetical protein
LFNPSEHDIDDMTDAEFQALMRGAPLSGGSVHGGNISMEVL